jgi:hypothetical protein
MTFSLSLNNNIGEVRDTTDIVRFASFLDIHLDIDTGGRLRMKIHDFNLSL